MSFNKVSITLKLIQNFQDRSGHFFGLITTTLQKLKNIQGYDKQYFQINTFFRFYAVCF